MIPKAINIGPLSLHLYGLLIALGILLGWYIAKRRASSYKIPTKIFDDYILIVPLVSALIFARIYHVLDYRNIYLQNPVTVFYIQNGGIGIWGAILGAIIGVWIVAKIKKLNTLKLLDLFAPSLAIGQAIGRIGNWINQEGFGPPTNLPWAVYIDPQNRPIQYYDYSRFHPTFFYEAILDLIIFLILLALSKKFKKNGQIFAFYLIFYSVVRFGMEFLRIDTWVMSGIKIAQFISLLGIVSGSLIILSQKAKQNKA